MYFQVQNLLQQMQDKFQNMSDQIINRNILFTNFISFFPCVTMINV